jgi:hypothetical protein
MAGGLSTRSPVRTLPISFWWRTSGNAERQPREFEFLFRRGLATTDAETIHTVAAILADGDGWVAPLRQRAIHAVGRLTVGVAAIDG